MSISQDRPNVLLIISDTLRYDFLSCYGGKVKTPTLDELANTGSLFKQAFSAGSGTAVSHSAMFSGQFPSETGLVGQTDIPENVPLIAEQLQKDGYDTFGIPGPGRMGSEWGYDRGFDEYFEAYTNDKPSYTSLRFLRDVLSDSTLRWPLIKDFIRTMRRGRDKLTSFKFDLLSEKIKNEMEKPFFGMLNTTLVHNPYDPPRPYKENATPSLDRPRWHVLEYLFDIDETLNRDDVRPERIYEAQKTNGIAKYLSDPDYLNQKEFEILNLWYKYSIKYLDNQLSNFLSRLDRNDCLRDTIIIFTADHGEYFGEHDLIGHTHFLYDEVNHVPLIINGPGVPEDERNDLVSLIDLFSTICNFASVESPDISSKPLFKPGSREAVFSEYGIRHTNPTGHRKYMSDSQLEEFGVGRKCIRTENYRYEYTSNGEEMLYERPNETLIDNPDEDVLEMHRDKLFQTLGRTFESTHENREISSNLEENLRKLGYIE